MARSKLVNYFCVTCREDAPHVIRHHAHDGGKVTRARECQTCQALTDLTFDDPNAGIVCPVCGHIKLFVLYTRNYDRQCHRAKQCGHCGHTVMTAERFESTAHKSKGRNRPRRPQPA